MAVYLLLNSSESIFRTSLHLNDRNPSQTFRSTVPNMHTAPTFFLRTSNSTITITTNSRWVSLQRWLAVRHFRKK
ncbi:hypothetical protein HZ326_10191 [Fusarium oxysporum f. sp. albedinis]|nr:hypothetical protein HZ326_10191 [Fusarium oxysporum f. sp. albedinis]